MTTEPGRRHDCEEIDGQEDTDGRRRRACHTRHEVSNERDGDNNGAGGDQRDGNSVKKLVLGQPCHVVHHALLEKWHDRESAAEDERPRLGEEQQNLQQHMLVVGGGRG